tara:strand:+ start:233 stop:556 length:324 start_codon:yes stop_codon:yes gene_type:complete
LVVSSIIAVLGVVMFIVAAAATIGLLVAVVILDFVKVIEDMSANVVVLGFVKVVEDVFANVVVVVVFILAIVYSPMFPRRVSLFSVSVATISFDMANSFVVIILDIL